MATSAHTVGSPSTAAPAAPERFLLWIRSHRQAASYALAVVILAGGLWWWNLLSVRRTEAIAGQRLAQARAAFENKNYPLATSELSRVVANYSGTRAAQEANVLIAHLRLAQGQPEAAIEQLKRFAPSASSEFKAQAYGLLGAAEENAGRARDAALAYEDAARYSLFPFLTAQYFSDAGRAWVAARDTARALAAYRAIVNKVDSTNTRLEAWVRIGELTKGSGQP